jgi:hypothetical protein
LKGRSSAFLTGSAKALAVTMEAKREQVSVN